jgi:hypothetical protein
MSRFAVFVLGLAILLGGCKGKPSTPDPVGVAGRVEYATGKPLDDAVVTFHPADESNKRGKVLSAPVQKGQFAGKCLPGRYKVTITLLAGGNANPAGGAAPSAGTTPDKGGSTIPAGYRSAASTPWDVTVPAEGKKDVRLTVR